MWGDLEFENHSILVKRVLVGGWGHPGGTQLRLRYRERLKTKGQSTKKSETAREVS